MPRKPDTMETVALALELMRRIPRNRKISAPELHQQLRDAGIERDLRTIQRQLKALSEHFDIEREPTRPAGYRWKERAPGMAIATMTEQEALLLSFARHVELSSDLEFGGRIKGGASWLDDRDILALPSLEPPS